MLKRNEQSFLASKANLKKLSKKSIKKRKTVKNSEWKKKVLKIDAERKRFSYYRDIVNGTKQLPESRPYGFPKNEWNVFIIHYNRQREDMI